MGWLLTDPGMLYDRRLKNVWNMLPHPPSPTKFCQGNGSPLARGTWFIAFAVCCMKTFMWDEWKWVLFGPTRSAGSAVILFTGVLYYWLSFVSSSIRPGSCALSDTEPRLSSEELLAASHQHVSSHWLRSVEKSDRKTSGGGLGSPQFYASVTTQCGMLSAYPYHG